MRFEFSCALLGNALFRDQGKQAASLMAIARACDASGNEPARYSMPHGMVAAAGGRCCEATVPAGSPPARGHYQLEVVDVAHERRLNLNDPLECDTAGRRSAAPAPVVDQGPRIKHCV
jgi:hypothetical protein